jgi:23S rRNA-/tRNA-specific pseudouridylate synthase
MITGQRIEVKEGGVRLDAALLRSFPSTTRAFVRDAIERGDVLIDGRRAAKGLKLRGGETIEVNELLEAKDNLVKPELTRPEGCGEISPRPFGPLFADPALLAFDKPAGMPVQPLSCRETGTLMNAVVAAYPECRALGPGLAALGESPLMAGALHRIDADTSGLVLVARTIDAFVALRDQFAAQTVKKTYLALVEGEVGQGCGERSPRTPPAEGPVPKMRLGTDPDGRGSRRAEKGATMTQGYGDRPQALTAASVFSRVPSADLSSSSF